MRGKHHFKANELLKKKGPEELDLEFTTSWRIELKEKLNLDTKEEEVCLVVMRGKIDFQFENTKGKADFKDMIYIPRRRRIQLYSNNAVLMYFSAPSEIDTQFSHIDFLTIDKNSSTHKSFGASGNNCRRDAWSFIDTDFNCSRLMMGLCEGDIGGWTSWPPHEHADKREEVYVYFNMGNAFGVQCVYDDMDNPYTVAIVRNGDLISIPRGYHPNVGCPAGKISYIYCMVSKKPGVRNFMDLKIQEIYGDKFE